MLDRILIATWEKWHTTVMLTSHENNTWIDCIYDNYWEIMTDSRSTIVFLYQTTRKTAGTSTRIATTMMKIVMNISTVPCSIYEQTSCLTTMTHNCCQFMIKWNHCAQIMDLCYGDLHPLRRLGRNYRINNQCQTDNEIPMINRSQPITGKPWHWKCLKHRMNIHCAAGLLLILLKDQSVLFDWNTSPSRYMGNVFTKRQWLIQHHV